MKRLLIVIGLLISLITPFAVISFAARPMQQDKPMGMSNDMDRAMMPIYGLVRSIKALGGDISVNGDKVSISLNLDAKQLEMLKEALAKPDQTPMPMAQAGNGADNPQWDSDYDYFVGRANWSNQFLHGTEKRGGYGENQSEYPMMGDMQGRMGGMGMMSMMPMEYEVTGKCPKCGAMIDLNMKCKMMQPKGEMGMGQRYPEDKSKDESGHSSNSRF
jgi:hypothetical protein